jgi:hypothetical protein
MEAKQVKLRLSAGDHRELVKAAKKAGRTLNAEIVGRLHDSFQAESLVSVIEATIERSLASSWRLPDWRGRVKL